MCGGTWARRGERERGRPAVRAVLPASGGELPSLCGRRCTWVGSAAAMLCVRRARRCRRGCARGVRAPGPAGFLPLAEGDGGGGLARDWSAAGRPRTWHLIGHAGFGLGGDEGIGGCRDASCSGSGGRETIPLMPAWRGDSGTEPEALRRKRVVAWRVACNGEGALLIPEAQSTTRWGVQAPGL